MWTQKIPAFGGTRKETVWIQYFSQYFSQYFFLAFLIASNTTVTSLLVSWYKYCI